MGSRMLAKTKTCKRTFHARLGNEIDAPRIPGITANQTGRSEYYAAQGPVFRYGLRCVLRTAWIKPARIRQGRRNSEPVKPDKR